MITKTPSPATPPANPADDQATRLRQLMQRETGPPERHDDEQADRRAIASGSFLGARTIAVASGKGGVGKTNLSVSLCAAFADMGCVTTLLDGDLGLGNADVVCGVSPRIHLGHVIEGRASVSQALLEVSSGFRLLPGASGIAKLAELTPEQQGGLFERLAPIERTSDVLVIDCGAGIGKPVLTFLNSADLALIVTTPEPTAITDAYALVKSLVGTWEPAARPPVELALVVNQADDGAHASNVHARFAAVCDRFLGIDMRLAGYVPSDNAVQTCVRARRPYYIDAPKSDAARRTRQLAGDLRRRLELATSGSPRRRGFLSRLMGR
ncbi:MAG: MinD/ParA family protein [Phycisphaerales bacterium]